MMCYTRHVITLFRVIRSSSSSSAGHRPIDCIFAIRKLIFLRSIGKLIHRAWIQFRRRKNNRKIMQCGFMDHQWASEQKFLRCPPPTAQIIRKLQNHPQSGVGGLASSRKKRVPCLIKSSNILFPHINMIDAIILLPLRLSTVFLSSITK